METTNQCDSLIPNSTIFEPEVSECLETPVNSNGDNSRTVEEVTTSSKPFVGMEFDSLHQAFLFYNEYAAIVGFSVRKDKTRKSNIDGSYLFRRFCCSKEGYPRNNRENPVKEEIRIIQPVGRSGRRVKLEMQRRAEVLQKMRVGCNAKIDVKRTSDGKWLVQKFVEEHNHECVRLGETHLLRSHRERQLDNSCGNVDNQGVGEHSSSDELDTRNDLSCIKPSVGMEFESHHKAFLFYNAYARRKDVGGITVKTRPQKLPITRVGCNAKCEVKKTDGKWVVQKFIEEHNHEFDHLGEMQVVKPIEGNLDEALITEGTEPKKVGAISTKAYQIAMSNIEMNLRVLEKAGEEDTCITQPDIQGIQSLCSPIEVVKNNGSSKHFTSEANGNLPTTSNIAISDPPHIRPRGRPPKRIISSLADPGNKKARPEPAASVHNTAPSNSRTMGLEPNDPSHAGGTSQETQNHSGLLWDSGKNLANFFSYISINELIIGPSGIPSSQTNQYDLNQEKESVHNNILMQLSIHFQSKPLFCVLGLGFVV
ncbi:hypothetical protein GIB67_014375 [Kingdonia uniflora]|uniref:FAR1 domain-containing protein n=1 Tax=Kingdonia uniflora TaxID=39325 RepID=A0A7J7LD27_9MAGN|nr:hypothetical protein GIB67_014375 [Kingdonia uniflora]